MTGWQLRLYRVEPGRIDDWLREWRDQVRPLREAKGFHVLGPWVGEDDRFVWLIGHDDFAAADAAYYESPERAQMDPDPARLLVETETLMLEEL
jgi:NIPSNAP